MPGWVSEGYQEYARRMPKECGVRLVEIPLGSRSGAANVRRAVEQAGNRLRAAVSRQSIVVALEEAGPIWLCGLLWLSSSIEPGLCWQATLIIGADNQDSPKEALINPSFRRTVTPDSIRGGIHVIDFSGFPLLPQGDFVTSFGREGMTIAVLIRASLN